MTNEQATRRYFTVLVPATIMFLGSSLAVKLLDEAGVLPLPGLYAVAVIPIVAMLVPFWAHWRYMSEIDEFLRSVQLKAMFAGLALVMSLASSWGYLEFYAGAPELSVFWLNPIYWIAYAVAAAALTLRYGAP
ncbi:hypothetical protein [Devosia nitrariae]|nr:hypothetical protein [Devosia nitrariae]